MHTDLLLIIRVGDFWHVNTKVGEKGRHLKAKVVTKKDLNLPPLIGWQYHVSGGKWESDPTMEWRSQPMEPTCDDVKVEFHPAAEVKLPDQWAGSYLPVEGKYSRGRPVGF